MDPHVWTLRLLCGPSGGSRVVFVESLWASLRYFIEFLKWTLMAGPSGRRVDPDGGKEVRWPRRLWIYIAAAYLLWIVLSTS